MLYMFSMFVQGGNARGRTELGTPYVRLHFTVLQLDLQALCQDALQMYWMLIDT